MSSLTAGTGNSEMSALVSRYGVDLDPADHIIAARQSFFLSMDLLQYFNVENKLEYLNGALLSAKHALSISTSHQLEHPSRSDCFDLIGCIYQIRFEHRIESEDLSDIDLAVEMGQQAVAASAQTNPRRGRYFINLGAALQLRLTPGGDPGYIEEANIVGQQGIELTQDYSSEKLISLHNRCAAYQHRFEHLGRLEDLSHSISLAQQLIELTPEGHPAISERLCSLGIAFHKRFEHLDDLSDMEQAHSSLQHAAEILPDGHIEKPAVLCGLALVLRARYERLGALEDRQYSVVTARRAIDLAPDGHPNKLAILNNLRIGFRMRFEDLGGDKDFEREINVNLRAVDLTPDDHPAKPDHLSNLGIGLLQRFKRLGELGDLERAIDANHRAVDLTPDDHPNLPGRLSKLGNGFFHRFKRLGELEDLERAIAVNRHAFELIPDGHRDKPMYLNNFGNGLLQRFERLGDFEDLERGIDANRRAVELTPDGHPARPTYLNNLGTGFFRRFKRLGKVEDLEYAIDVNGHAVELTPDGNPNKRTYFDSLGNSFRARFERLGDIGDLQRGIDANLRAVELTPDSHTDKSTYLNNLGDGFRARFEHLGEVGDLERAIDSIRCAINLTPDDHPEKPAYLNSLGNGFRTRFKSVGGLGDLERAIDANRRADDLTPVDHPDKPSHLNSLGNSLLTRFEHVGEIEDLDHGIHVNRYAVELTPNGHPEKPVYLNNLALGFQSRFERLGDVGDLEHAIDANRRAVDLIPDSHSKKPGMLSGLGSSLSARFKRFGRPADFQDALQTYLFAADQEFGPPSIRLNAVKQSADMCLLGLQRGLVAHGDLVRVYERAISLIPQVNWLGNTLNRRSEEFAHLSQLVNGAVAATVAAGQPTRAVEWFEQGRSMAWGQLLQLHSPLDDLRAIRPDQAKELQDISRALEDPARLSINRQTLQDEAAGRILQDETSARVRLAGRRDEVLENIRSIAGFEQFLMPKLYSTLARASKSGPVVLINVHESRCDALVIYSSTEDPVHVPLPKLSKKDVSDMHQQFLSLLTPARVRERGDGSPRRDGSGILLYLWLYVVHPVLEAIEKKLHSSIIDSLPHVTWCPTGPLALLPLHAAGEYGQKGGRKVFDFVVSSYTPTLSMLLQMSTNLVDLHSTSDKTLVVSQPRTPGFSPLPESLTEATKIKRHFNEDQIIHMSDTKATVDAVLAVINDRHTQFIHLACLGDQDADDPANSAFLLHDGRLELRQLMATSMPSTTLAFLSAISHTSSTKGDVNFLEESMPLAAGMLTVGCQAVVATPWSIMEEDAPIVVDEFYRRLKENTTDLDGDRRARVAYALHGATEVLRKKVGEANFLRWAAFIHLG